LALSLAQNPRMRATIWAPAIWFKYTLHLNTVCPNIFLFNTRRTRLNKGELKLIRALIPGENNALIEFTDSLLADDEIPEAA
jgi:hypothetical protein